MTEWVSTVGDWRWLVASGIIAFFGVFPYYYQFRRIKLALDRNWVVRELLQEAHAFKTKHAFMLVLAVIIAGIPVVGFFRDVPFSNYNWIAIAIITVYFIRGVEKSIATLEQLKEANRSRQG